MKSVNNSTEMNHMLVCAINTITVNEHAKILKECECLMGILDTLFFGLHV